MARIEAHCLGGARGETMERREIEALDREREMKEILPLLDSLLPSAWPPSRLPHLVALVVARCPACVT